MNSLNTKHIFILGLSLSSLGKGIVSASIGRIFKENNFKVTIQKFDGYLNSSSSSLNPYEHGESYILDNYHTNIGPIESDLDIGTYERFLSENLIKYNSVTSGIIYNNVLKNEKEGKYLGQTVQIIPHVTNEIKRYMHLFDDDYDIVIHEIGGTAGSDIEVWPYTEAIRQMKNELANNCLIIALAYLPLLKTTNEIKTKIAQHGVESIRSVGINSDILICRSEKNFNDSIKNKLSLFTGINKNNIIKNLDASSIYHIPQMLIDEGIVRSINRQLDLHLKEDIDQWNRLTTNSYQETIDIGLIGKYISLKDSYKSIIESLKFAGWKNFVNVNLHWIDAEDFDVNQLKNLKGILICPGFGYRGFEGKIKACQFAREHKIPCLGICFGAQAMWIEFARNVLHLKDANSEEFVQDNVHSKNYIVHLMNEQKNLKEMSGTLRLGFYPCKISTDSISYEFFKDTNIYLKHRHRYEFNNDYKDDFENKGMLLVGKYKDNIVEITELVNHPFYVGCQGHPEMDSFPDKPNPLFDAFIFYAKNINRKVNL